VARRVHLTGSASKDCDPELLRWAHEALREFLRAHLREGGSLIAQLGGEPYHPADATLPLTFDWLILEAALEALRAGEAAPRPRIRWSSCVVPSAVSSRFSLSGTRYSTSCLGSGPSK